jgi:hypothetical protein
MRYANEPDTGPMDAEATVNVFGDAVKIEVDAETTDQQLSWLIDGWISEAEALGYTGINREYVRILAVQHRDRMQLEEGSA